MWLSCSDLRMVRPSQREIGCRSWLPTTTSVTLYTEASLLSLQTESVYGFAAIATRQTVAVIQVQGGLKVTAVGGFSWEVTDCYFWAIVGQVWFELHPLDNRALSKPCDIIVWFNGLRIVHRHDFNDTFYLAEVIFDDSHCETGVSPSSLWWWIFGTLSLPLQTRGVITFFVFISYTSTELFSAWIPSLNHNVWLPPVIRCSPREGPTVNALLNQRSRFAFLT